MTIAFSAGAGFGRSPGASNRARAWNSRSASSRVRSSTSVLAAIAPIVSTRPLEELGFARQLPLGRFVPPPLRDDQVRGQQPGERNRERRDRRHVRPRIPDRQRDNHQNRRRGNRHDEQPGVSR